jgi:cytochrome b561
MFRNTDSHYGLVAKFLHWIIGVLIIGLIWLGWYMVDLTYFDRWYNESLTSHKALGLMVFALACCKILWMLANRAPPLPSTIAGWQRAAANGMHYLLVAMMLLIPVSGYLISTSAGQAVDIFGWLEVPAVFKIETNVRELAIDVHYYLAYGCAAAIAGHALVAIKHQFLDKDGTLARMLWE